MKRILMGLKNKLANLVQELYKQIQLALKIEKSAREMTQALVFWIRVTLLVSVMLMPNTYRLECNDCGEGNLIYEIKPLY